MKLQGEVAAVVAQAQGAVVVSWVGTVMTVVNAADFPRVGGAFSPDGGQTVFTYQQVTEGAEEDAPDVVATDQPAPTSWPAEESWVDVWPAALDVIAEVLTEADDSVPAVVPHALRPILTEGIRDGTDREWVELEQRDGQWTVADVIGRRAVVRADAVEGLDEAIDDLQERLDQSAEELAEAKADLDRRTKANEAALVDEALATKVAALVGDFADLFATKITGKMLNVDEALAQKLQAVIATFQSVFAGTIVADMIQLDTLAGKSISGVDWYSPSPTALPRVHVGEGAVEVYRSSESDAPAITMGGLSGDAFTVTDPATGGTIAALDSDGNLTGTKLTINGDADVQGDLNAADLQINGQSVEPWLNSKTDGQLAAQRLGATASGNGVRFGSGWLGYYELYFPSYKGRRQRVSYDGTFYASAAGHYYFQIVGTSSAGYDAAPAYTAPKADGSNANLIVSRTIYAPAAGYYPLTITGYTEDYAGRYRVLLAARTASGGYGEIFSLDNIVAWFTAEDIGPNLSIGDGGYNQGGGTPYSGGTTAPVVVTVPPPPAKKTYTSTWRASHYATYREGIGQMGTGQYRLQQGVLDGKSRWSWVGFLNGAHSGETGKTIAQALAGATISRVEVYLYCEHTYASTGGTALIGKSTLTGAPANPQTSGGTPTSVTKWQKGTGKWVTLPSSWAPTIRSISLGEGGTSTTHYMKFTPDPARLMLRVTYTR